MGCQFVQLTMKLYDFLRMTCILLHRLDYLKCGIKGLYQSDSDEIVQFGEYNVDRRRFESFRDSYVIYSRTAMDQWSKLTYNSKKHIFKPMKYKIFISRNNRIHI